MPVGEFSEQGLGRAAASGSLGQPIANDLENSVSQRSAEQLEDQEKASGGLHPMEASELQARRERVFLLLAGLFLGSMTMLNILGISRFIKLYELPWQLANGQTWNITFAVAIGVLPVSVL